MHVPMLVRTLRFVLDLALGGAAWVFLVPWCAAMLLHVWREHVAGPPPDEVALLAGLTLGLISLLWARPNLLLHTWLHETAHALMCLLLFVRVGAITATAGKGGETRHEPVRVRLLPILIAPYVLPLIAGPLLVARWLSPEGLLRTGLTFACGLGLFMHLHGLALNLRLNTVGANADLPRVGHLLAFALIIAALLLMAAAAVVVLWSTQPPAWWERLFSGPSPVAMGG
jgi:hypothetical protein